LNEFFSNVDKILSVKRNQPTFTYKHFLIRDILQAIFPAPADAFEITQATENEI